MRTLLAVVLLACSSGCTQPATQLVVSIESDLPASRLAEVRVEATPLDALDGPPTATNEFVVRDASGASVVAIPFSFGVLPPGGDPARRVELMARAIAPDGAEVVTRRVRTGFLRGQSLHLPVFLAGACEGVSCEMPDTTCDRGACVPVAIEPTALAPIRPGQELADAGALDAAAPDAGAGCTPHEATLVIPTSSPVLSLSLSRVGDGRDPRPILVTHAEASGLTATRVATDLTDTVRVATHASADVGTLASVAPIDGSADFLGLVQRGDTVELVATTAAGTLPHTTPVAAGTAAVGLPSGATFARGAEVWGAWVGTAGHLSLARLAIVGGAPALQALGDTLLIADVAGMDVASATRGVLVAREQAGACVAAMYRLDGSVEVAEQTIVASGCSHPSIAELSTGQIVVAYSQAAMDPTIEYEVRGADLSPIVSARSPGQDGRAASTARYRTRLLPRDDGSFVVMWVQPGGSIAYARVDPGTGLLGTVEVVDRGGATFTADELASLEAIRLGDALVAAWATDAGVWLARVCDRP